MYNIALSEMAGKWHNVVDLDYKLQCCPVYSFSSKEFQQKLEGLKSFNIYLDYLINMIELT
jgi:hypothetical protein